MAETVLFLAKHQEGPNRHKRANGRATLWAELAKRRGCPWANCSGDQAWAPVSRLVIVGAAMEIKLAKPENAKGSLVRGESPKTGMSHCMAG